MQICLEYAQHMGPSGLKVEGLCSMYASGYGSLDDDYKALGLPYDFPPEVIHPLSKHAVVCSLWVVLL